MSAASLTASVRAFSAAAPRWSKGARSAEFEPGQVLACDLLERADIGGHECVAGADLADELAFGFVAQRPSHGQLVEAQDGEDDEEDDEGGEYATADDEPDHGHSPRSMCCVSISDTSVYAGFRIVANRSSSGHRGGCVQAPRRLCAVPE